MAKKAIYRKNEFKQAIINKRIKEDIPVRQAADEIGISRSALNRAETSGVPLMETYGKICIWLGVPVSKFFNLK